MMRNEVRQIFTVYRWHNPETTSDYPYLAVAEDRSMLLQLGNYGIAFDWGIPEEVAELLATDFQPIGSCLAVDLLTVQAALSETFVHGTEFGSITFDAQLVPRRLQLSLGQANLVELDDPVEPLADDRGPEYVIEGFGSYLRFDRAADQCVPVSFPERCMLDTCVSTFAELAGQCAALLSEPPPPRYRAQSGRASEEAGDGPAAAKSPPTDSR